jgi:hypothetical protein
MYGPFANESAPARGPYSQAGRCRLMAYKSITRSEVGLLQHNKRKPLSISR